ncbi:MAG: DUF58 domain-containing protein [Planctomycetia bacterium]|nr:DUF58 domain-containing protein [Planctomycetia bacterium]
MKLTAIGRYYLILLLLILFAGFRREVNLLLLLSAFMAGPLVFHLFLPRWIVRGISLKRTVPESVFPGEKCYFTVELSTLSFFRFGGVTVDARPGGAKFQLESVRESSEAGKARQTLRYSATFDHRGEYTLPDVTVCSDYPFGYTCARRTFSDGAQILVLPKFASRFPSCPDIPTDEATTGQTRPHFLPSMGDFCGLRPFQRGDLPGRIHWRASARHDALLVQQNDAPQQTHFALVADFTDDDDARFEQAVSIVAAVVHEMLRGPERRYFHTSLSLKIIGRKIVVLTSASTEDFYYAAMRELAIVERRDPSLSVELPEESENLWVLRSQDGFVEESLRETAFSPSDTASAGRG